MVFIKPYVKILFFNNYLYMKVKMLVIFYAPSYRNYIAVEHSFFSDVFFFLILFSVSERHQSLFWRSFDFLWRTFAQTEYNPILLYISKIYDILMNTAWPPTRKFEITETNSNFSCDILRTFSSWVSETSFLLRITIYSWHHVSQ